MKTGTKVFLGIVGGLLGAALLLWAIVPTLPVYLLIKHKIDPEILNKTLIEVPYTELEIPSDYQRVSECGLSIYLPADMKLSEKAKEHLRTYRSDAGWGIVFINHDDDPEGFQFIGENGLSQKDYDRFVSAIKWEKPTTNYDMYYLIMNLTPKDIKLTKHGSWRPILEMMNSKEQFWKATGREGYPLEAENGIGYYTIYGEPNGTRKDYRILVELYDKEDKNRCASAIISADTLENAVRIANSADFDRAYQPEDKDE